MSLSRKSFLWVRVAREARCGCLSFAKLKAIVNLLSARLARDGALHGLRPWLARQLNFVFLQDRLQALAEVPRVLLGFHTSNTLKSAPVPEATRYVRPAGGQIP